MRVLVVGTGGREAAIGWKLKQDPKVKKIFFARGNASTEEFGENIFEDSIPELVEFATREKIDLTIVGPEAPLVDGIVDEFKAAGLKIFGPNAKAASLEGSKAFSKKFMQDHGIKTAKAEVFDVYQNALDYVKDHKFPLVIKASGLAGGKGVVICEDLEEAEAVIHDFMIRRIHGDAGIKLVIEEFLQGFEASIICFSNGTELFPCIPVKDYKKVGEGDEGMNTGGMGTVAPSPEFNGMHYADFERNIMLPTLKGLKEENLSFKGFIFFGLMVTSEGSYLLEYNMRLGDPETQVILPLLENSLIDVIQDCMEGKPVELKFADKKAVCVVMVSGGYPRNIETGLEIKGVDKVETLCLLAGARKGGNNYYTTGGRVVNVVGFGETYDDARKQAYDNIKKISFDYGFYRHDIGLFEQKK
ncbi:phosphoribosylamine--glycine ligase [Elizabethkingia meningoseptica]|uniref:Phosphoribosylamine--glycine ligase n=1 Tax=Elizabethkingia meningoseptica TaxID=238 RepID=A0A1V3U0Q4_ELIME|nr:MULTISPECIES: phosphoribosylamine--glycine ligase [Elizabethkingia]AQX06081.1 phosphoribosylamine--glycine ligase [Elizabethkingia meningoseptica]AQX13622.1 phosphoribosylamine--glycine ligase [Elizabethkingia meningoseptica]AQX48127.1 phosphoribosylamine--glycine ligase [Elizabethkingia meningoseptica]EJK5327483.1 phosphoribosylamine--glycine ligase [Elizabethkingia meningoseptica]EOR30270.1 phosphoribosylamine--glycine ligase [Elizabethkingia meningoseptica ATCC 13253 = NBRC 12535]